VLALSVAGIPHGLVRHAVEHTSADEGVHIKDGARIDGVLALELFGDAAFGYFEFERELVAISVEGTLEVEVRGEHPREEITGTVVSHDGKVNDGADGCASADLDARSQEERASLRVARFDASNELTNERVLLKLGESMDGPWTVFNGCALILIIARHRSRPIDVEASRMRRLMDSKRRESPQDAAKL